MKKNWTTRVAVALLALTMITSCFVGSTFAKYVTKAEGTDNARVAKWGIVLTAAGTPLFKTEYETDDTHGYEGLSVESSDDDCVVAPGTTKAGFTATVAGTPEVAVRYELKLMKEGFKDIVLPAGTDYVDYTVLTENADHEWGYNETFDLDKPYAPLKWDIGVGYIGGQPIYLLSALLADHPGAAAAGLTPVGASATDAIAIMSNPQYQPMLASILQGMVSGAQNVQFTDTDEYFAISMDFEPNKTMNYQFTLSWNWWFDNETELPDGSMPTFCNDQADTYLGNLAAEIADIVVPEGASTELKLHVIASATQID